MIAHLIEEIKELTLRLDNEDITEQELEKLNNSSKEQLEEIKSTLKLALAEQGDYPSFNHLY